jgi:16S rRNA U516 pseudouridylate synthase RsuA-like enzyme
MFNQEKIDKIRKGVKVNGKVLKFWVETISQKNSNSWIHLKSYDNSISDIRNIFERLSLRINRIIRTDYGPFRIGKLKNPGDIIETHIPSSVNTYMYYRYKEKLQSSVRKLDDSKLEIIKNNMIIEQKIK